jgi:hypothetical protein
MAQIGYNGLGYDFVASGSLRSVACFFHTCEANSVTKSFKICLSIKCKNYFKLK